MKVKDDTKIAIHQAEQHTYLIGNKFLFSKVLKEIRNCFNPLQIVENTIMLIR
jgi:hypothetical protein